MIRAPEFGKYIALHIHGFTLLHLIEKEIVVLDLERINGGSLLGYESVVLGGVGLGRRRCACAITPVMTTQAVAINIFRLKVISDQL